MALTAISPIPVALPHDQEVYSAAVVSVKQGVHSSGKGLICSCPLVLDGTFATGEIRLPSGETRRIKATQLTAINKLTVDEIDLIDAIKTGRLASFYKEDGLVKELHVHPDWFKRMQTEEAGEIVFRDKIDGTYEWLKENDDVSIESLSEDSYRRMVDQLGFGTILNMS